MKLSDANLAGGKSSHKCTLILTEGDSAKSLAISGLSIIGRDKYGVFPLRGKFLNVRDASSNQLQNNQEFTHIKQILGLKQNVEYTDINDLRYGHIMIMTDQVCLLTSFFRIMMARISKVCYSICLITFGLHY